MDCYALYKRNRAALRIGLKLLVAIIGIELLIMTGFEFSGLANDSMWAGVVDAMLLGLLSAGLVYAWVVRPMKQAHDRDKLFSTVVNNLSVGVVVTEVQDGEQRIVTVNPAFSRITGYMPEEVIGSHPRFMQGEDVDKSALEKTKQAIRQEEAVTVLLKNRRKDGTPFWNNLHLSPVQNGHGKVMQWVGLVDDVSEQKKLRDRAIRMSKAIEQAEECMSVITGDGRIEAANPSFVSTVGAADEDALKGASYWQFWDEDDPVTQQAMEALREGRSWSGKHRRKRLDGSLFESITGLTPLGVEDGEMKFSALSRDISDLAEVEAQLMQAQKMEAVGTLAGGIAHDFNNMLAGMLGNMYLLQRDMQDNPKALMRLKRIEKQGYQAADVIRQLLTFARSSDMEKKDFDLKPFFKEMAKFARPGIPENIELIADIANEKMKVNGDPVRIQQAILNLITNARHAIEQKADAGGRIVLRSSISAKREGCRGACRMQGKMDEAPAACVCIEVEDNGVGMDATTVDRIFEPYFTTKEVGRGTGLGLPMVQGCVEMQGGCIDVESAPGKGTCFRIRLPLLADDTQMTVPGEEDDVELVRGNGELILVADDNSDAREALREMLEEAGFEVVTAADGEEARQLFYVNRQRLHAAFLDIVMPRCSGTIVAREISETCPEIPMVLMTGYDIRDTLSSERFGILENIDVLRKPWNLTQINDALSKMQRKHLRIVNSE